MQPQEKHTQGRRKLRLSVRWIALGLGALPMLTLGAAGVWVHHSWSEKELERQRGLATATANSLADTARVLLSSGDVSPLRTLVGDVNQQAGLVECEIMLSNGQVAAHSDTSRLGKEAVPVPVSWEAVASSELETGTTVAANGVRTTVAFDVPGRGSGWATARAAKVGGHGGWGTSEILEGLGAIGLAGVGVSMLFFRASMGVLRPLLAIQGALRDATQGEGNGTALRIAAGWGAEAAAWNGLLAEREALRTKLLDKRIDEAGGTARSADGPLERACDALASGLVVIDGTLKVRFANGAACVLLGAPKGGMTGQRLTEVVTDERVIELTRAVATNSTRRRGTVELERPSADDQNVLRVTVSRAGTEGSAVAVMTIDDLTQQRVADKARDTFVTQATHELRTPLTNIRLYIESLLEGGQEEAERAHAVNVINQEARRLERMVSDMLSVAEIEAGSMKLHADDVRLGPLFEELEADYKAQATEKEITLTWDLPPKWPVLSGDRDKVVMALHNLVGNALKYTPAGGSVVVAVEIGVQAVLVRVKDNGIGIAPDEAERIFEKFYRSKDRRVAKITGTGLGLALAREVVRLHGGDITVDSQIDRGSTFTMSLPMGGATELAQAA